MSSYVWHEGLTSKGQEASLNLIIDNILNKNYGELIALTNLDRVKIKKIKVTKKNKIF
jgi:hypothetical protein